MEYLLWYPRIPLGAQKRWQQIMSFHICSPFLRVTEPECRDVFKNNHSYESETILCVSVSFLVYT